MRSMLEFWREMDDLSGHGITAEVAHTAAEAPCEIACTMTDHKAVDMTMPDMISIEFLC